MATGNLDTIEERLRHRAQAQILAAQRIMVLSLAGYTRRQIRQRLGLSAADVAAAYEWLQDALTDD